jgi:hypothetical protein
MSRLAAVYGFFQQKHTSHTARFRAMDRKQAAMDSDVQHDFAMSRRGLVKGAAGAAALGTAVLASAGTPAQAQTDSASGRVGVAAAGSVPSQAEHRDAGETVVVHVRDARTGDLDLYVGDRHVRVRDRDLASRLIAAAR